MNSKGKVEKQEVVEEVVEEKKEEPVKEEINYLDIIRQVRLKVYVRNKRSRWSSRNS